MYVYIQSENANECPPNGLYTVGFYNPNLVWVPESDHTSKDAAAERVAYLNGGVSRHEALRD